MRLSIHSLPVRLSIWICLVLLFCLSATAVLLGYLWMQRLTERLNEQGVNTASETAYMLDRIFVQAEQATQILATVLERTPPPPEELPGLLRSAARSMHERCSELNGIGIAYKENMYIPGEKHNFFVEYEHDGQYVSLHLSDRSEMVDYPFKDWFGVPLTLEKPVWTVPYYSDVESKPLIFSYSVPFFRSDGGERRSAGVVEAGIQVEDLAKFLDNTSMEGLRNLSRNSEIFLMNQFGQIVLFPGKEDMLSDTIFTLCDESVSPDLADRRAAQSVFRQRAGRVSFRSVPRLMGKSELFHASCVNGWVVCIVTPYGWQAPLLLPVLIRFLLGTVLVLCVVVVVIFVICRKLSGPLLQLSGAAKEIGKGNFAAPLPDFKRDDEVGDLTNSFRQMQSALEDYIAKLKETVAARERSEGELNAAKAIQQDILPGILPPLPDCRNLICAADLVPARGVGGDLFDIFPVDQDHWALIIGDVSGKGIPAALFMAVTQTLQRSIAQTLHTPQEIVTRLNRMLAKDNSTEMFVTYWLGILNIRNGELVFTNGGHNPPLLKRAGGPIELLKQRHGPMLGIVPARQYGSETVRLLPGDMLILYTDGVTEAVNSRQEMFGDARLLATVAAHKEGMPGEMLDAIRAAVFSYAEGVEQADDITMLLVQYGAGCCDELTVPAETEQLERVMEFFDDFPATGKLSGKACNQLRVCLEEMFANIVMHAYVKEAGAVTVRMWEEAGELRLRFTDSGREFNPLEHPEPDLELPVGERPIGGLGIHIIRKLMDYCDYRYEDGRNILTVGKAM